MAVQKSVIPPPRGPLSAYTIYHQRRGKGHDRFGGVKSNSQAKSPTVPVYKSPQIYSPASQRANAVSNGNNIDERLKAARERREEQQKFLVSRELDRLEREQRARCYYEQQLRERKKKILEQRLKEETRRAAVEEKRNQRLKEEKERHESTVRKTLEKSRKARQSQNIQGRKATQNTPRRPPPTPWEKNLVSRLLTPTFSYLARSKSAGCQSGEEASHHSINTPKTTIITTSPQKPQVQQKKPPQQQQQQQQQRQPYGVTRSKIPLSPSPNRINSGSQRRSVNQAQIKPARPPDTNRKNAAPPSSKNRSSPINSTKTKPAASSKTPSPPASPSPSPNRTGKRSISRHSAPLYMELPSVPEEDPSSVCVPALTPGNSRPVQSLVESRQEKLGLASPAGIARSNPPGKGAAPVIETAGGSSPAETPPPSTLQLPQVTIKPATRATDPGEASRLLAERRREARIQREREEQERLQREAEERRCREELERQRTEERARQQAEAQRLIEEKMRREEEEQRRAEEERAQALREAALLQKQREEEQARERAKAEQIRQERELLAAKEEEARQVRKKRLEEIMRRTRRTDSSDMKTTSARTLPNAAQPKENTQPVHNGTIEDAAKLPVGTKTLQLGLTNEDDMVPVVAFKERRSLRTLTGLEEIQTHQRAGYLSSSSAARRSKSFDGDVDLSEPQKVLVAATATL